MQKSKLKTLVLLLLCASTLLPAQDNWMLALQGKISEKKPSVTLIIQDENGLVPSVWLETINTGIEYGFKNSQLFSKIHKAELKGGSYLSGHGDSQYFARITFQKILIDEERPEEYISNKSTEVYVKAILKMYDVVDGTLELAKEMTFQDKVKPHDDMDEIAGHFRKEITSALYSNFPAIMPLKEGHVTVAEKGKLKEISIAKYDFARMLEPRYIYAYIKDKDLDNMYTFKQIGSFIKSSSSKHKNASRVVYQTSSGKKDMMAAFPNATIYLSSNAL